MEHQSQEMKRRVEYTSKQLEQLEKRAVSLSDLDRMSLVELHAEIAKLQAQKRSLQREKGGTSSENKAFLKAQQELDRLTTELSRTRSEKHQAENDYAREKARIDAIERQIRMFQKKI